ncbi:MAG: class IV adenylate cyclase [Acidobacteria bacterium]|nr:class IV adenylate cyclase [Acidobacteriota bacterium]
MRQRETEVKLRIPSAPAIKKQLRQIGFRCLHRRCLEDNVLFDTGGQTLRRARCLLRLRRYGSRWVLTYKGPPAKDRFFKSRLELETAVEDPQILQALFEQLELHPVFRYQKYRTQYFQESEHSRLETAVDETPIGNFLEIEGSRAAIDRVARQLGYSRRDYCTASYWTLYVEHCRQKNILPQHMVFPSE